MLEFDNNVSSPFGLARNTGPFWTMCRFVLDLGSFPLASSPPMAPAKTTLII